MLKLVSVVLTKWNALTKKGHDIIDNSCVWCAAESVLNIISGTWKLNFVE